MGRVLLLVALAGCIAACSSRPPQTAGQAPPGISYRIEGDNIAGANQRADQYCQQYGRHARLQTVNHSGSDNIAVYACT